MPTVILLGSLDTKGTEYGYVRDRLRAAGLDSVLVDVGVLRDPSVPPDVSAAAIAQAANVELDDLRAKADRGAAMSAMAAGAAIIAQELVATGGARGILGLGGSGGTTLIPTSCAHCPSAFPSCSFRPSRPETPARTLARATSR